MSTLAELQQRARAVYGQLADLVAVLDGISVAPPGFDIARACQGAGRAAQEIEAVALDLAQAGPDMAPAPMATLYLREGN